MQKIQFTRPKIKCTFLSFRGYTCKKCTTLSLCRLCRRFIYTMHEIFIANPRRRQREDNKNSSISDERKSLSFSFLYRLFVINVKKTIKVYSNSAFFSFILSKQRIIKLYKCIYRILLENSIGITLDYILLILT